MLPREFIGGFIRGHEGVLSMTTADNGNWYDAARYRAGLPQRRAEGRLVGSKFGVTAYAIVRYRLLKGWSLERALVVTAADVAALAIETAVDIGFVLYFQQPGFAALPWNRATASIVDKGWGSGPGTAIRLLQKMIGTDADGRIGPQTIAAFAAYLARHGEDGTARTWGKVRRQYDLAIATNEGPQDPDRLFIGGWNNRTDSFLPGTAWWRGWNGKVAA